MIAEPLIFASVIASSHVEAVSPTCILRDSSAAAKADVCSIPNSILIISSAVIAFLIEYSFLLLFNF
jgi:hypothetical protein